MKTTNSILIISALLLIAAPIIMFYVFFSDVSVGHSKPHSIKSETSAVSAPLALSNITVSVRPSISSLPQLELIGTIICDGDSRLAIIRDTRTGYEHRYRVGDRITSFVLSEVGMGTAVLSQQGGEKETLFVKDATRPIQNTPTDIITSDGEKKVVKKNALIAKYNNPNNIIKEAKVLLALSGGKINGIKIKGLKEGGIIEKAGLKKEDVVKAVDGLSIKDIKSASEIYKKLARSARGDSPFKVEIALERDGQDKNIVYEVVN